MYARRNRPSAYSYSASSGRWKTRGIAGRSRGGWRPQRNYGSASAKASRALQLIRKFKNEEEKKEIVNNKGLNIATATTTGSFTDLNSIAQGNTKNTRIGNKVTMESIAFRLQTKLNTAEANPVTHRVMILMDRRPNGALPAGTDLLETDSLFGLYSTAEDVSGRFQVLYDRTITLATGGKEAHFRKIFIPLKGKKASYTGNAGTIADLQKNSLILACWVDGNTQTVVFTGRYRFRFTDA